MYGIVNENGELIADVMEHEERKKKFDDLNAKMFEMIDSYVPNDKHKEMMTDAYINAKYLYADLFITRQLKKLENM
jgi:hypothetical protein